MSIYNSRIGFQERKSVAELSGSLLQLHRNTRPEPFSSEDRMQLTSLLQDIDLHKYPDLADLRSAVANLVGQQEHLVTITSGVDGAIRDALDVFCNPGDKILYLTPCYMMYRIYANAYQLDKIEIPCDDNLLYDFNTIIESVETQDVRIVFLTNPHSPVDYSVDDAEFKLLMQVAARKGTLVFVDEAYHYYGAVSRISEVTNYDNLMVARTFSKAFCLPSVRLGLLCSSQTIAEKFTGRRLAYETSMLSCVIGLSAINNFHMVESHVMQVARSRERLQEALTALGYKTHGTNLNSLIMRGLGESQAKSLVSFLVGQEVVIRTLAAPYNSNITFTIGNDQSCSHLIDGITAFLD